MYALNKPLKYYIKSSFFALNLCYWDQLVINEIEKIVVFEATSSHPI